MKNVILFVFGLLLLIAGVYILIRPSGVTVSVPEYANAQDMFGYIKGFEDQNGIASFRFDEADWVTGEGSADMPNGFKIVNDHSALTGFFFAPELKVTVIDLAAEEPEKEVTLDMLREDFLREPDVFNGRPFWISFDEQGRVKEMREQYVP